MIISGPTIRRTIATGRSFRPRWTPSARDGEGEIHMVVDDEGNAGLRAECGERLRKR